MLQSLHQSRVRILAYGLLVIGVIFVLRLFYIQVIRHDYYTERARAEQVKTLAIPAKRGEIYIMSQGQPRKIVINEAVYNVVADPMITTEDEAIAKLVRQVAGGEAKPDIAKRLSNKKSRYQMLATNLTHAQAEKIKEAGFAGVLLQQSSRRTYPEGGLAAQTLGFVNADGEGRYGIEGYFDEALSGKDGMLKSVTDVANVPLTIGDQNIDQPAEDGDDIVLSIDRNIQSQVEKMINTKRKDIPNKSIIVMDPNSGRIVAMANTPSYEPGQYNRVKDISKFNNNIISDPYEPGSVMKAFTVAAGIDKGVITPSSTFNNTDNVKIGEWNISNATKGQLGSITFQHALDYSLNTGMVEILNRLDGSGRFISSQSRQILYNYLHDGFKLGQLTGVELSGEAGGVIVDPAAQEGSAVRYANMSFGQGMDLTMLQVASGFSALVNGGTYYQPTVVAGNMEGQRFVPSQAKALKKNVVSPKTSSTLRSMLHQARQEFYSSSDRPGYYVGGKTGTSETAVDGKYTMSTTVASYLGFGGEVNKPAKYVIMVRTSGEGLNLQGNLDAMPFFTDLSNWLLEYYKLAPKGN